MGYSETATGETHAFRWVPTEGMVAMSTHGRTGLDRIVHGSVAEYLLHHDSVPMLLYHPTPET